MSKYFSHPSLDFAFNIDGEFNSPWYDKNLFGLDNQPAVEGTDEHGSLVGDNQKVTVRIVKRRFSHRCVCTVCIDGDPLFESGFACTHKRHKALDEVDLAFLH